MKLCVCVRVSVREAVCVKECVRAYICMCVYARVCLCAYALDTPSDVTVQHTSPCTELPVVSPR